MTSLYLFDNNQDLIKIVPQKDLIQARQKEELQENDLPIDRFTAEYKLDAFKDVEAIHYFAVKDLNKPNQFHMYFLKQPIIHENTVLLEGTQLGYKELKHFIIQEVHPQNRQAEFMMNQALKGTGWRVGYVAETVEASQHFYFMPTLEALKVISGLFGIELVFKVEISGQKITDKWVEAYNRRGSRTMKRFTHGSNLLSIKGTIERDNVYTALIGRGRGEETEGGGFGRRITFEEIEWSVANGDPVDKPLGLNYVEIPSATEEFGINMPDGSKAPAMGVVEFQDIEEPDELLSAVYNELAYRIRPLVQYETTVADVGDVELGEVVGVHRYDLDLHYETRIFKLTRDYLNPKRTPIELGDKVIESRRDREVRTQKTIGNIDREQTDIRSEINRVGHTADGKNVINWGNEEPEQARVGDMWFRDHPTEPGIRQRLVFDGDGWEVPPYNAGDLNGVLNGDELNVINLNADSIVTGTLTGLKFVNDFSRNGTAGQLVIDGDVRMEAGPVGFSLDENMISFNDATNKTNVSHDGLTFFRNGQEVAGFKMNYFSSTGSSSVTFTNAREGEVGLRISQNRIETTNRGEGTVDSPIYLTPSGNGRVQTTDDTGTLWYGLDTKDIQLQRGGSVKELVGGTMEITSVEGLNIRQVGATNYGLGINKDRVRVQRPLDLAYNGITDLRRVDFSGGGEIYETAENSELNIKAFSALTLRQGDGTYAVNIDATRMKVQRDIDMSGNTITNQSDIRLKTNVEDSALDALGEIGRMKFIDYEWDLTHPANEDKPEGRKFGIVAQYSPFLQTKVGDSESYLSVDMTKQVNLNSKAIQELYRKVVAIDERTSIG